MPILTSLLGSLFFSIVSFLAKFLTKKIAILAAVILAYCGIGVFALNDIVFDMWALLIFGMVGLTLKTLGFPLAPMILGVVLGHIAELNLNRALSTSDDLLLFITRPCPVHPLRRTGCSGATASNAPRPARGSSNTFPPTVPHSHVPGAVRATADRTLSTTSSRFALSGDPSGMPGTCAAVW